LHERLWLLAVFFGISGIILYVPQYMPGSNKDSQSLSSLDAVLIGVSTGLGAVPGISRMGSSLSVSLMRGVERRYALDLGLLLGVPALIVLIVFDVWWLLTGTAAAVTGMVILCSVTAAVASFVSSYLGMFIMRFLSVKIGFSGFAYYCWGVALFTLIIYLMIS
jgi:undecaprenyl-diphosphatase